LRQAALDEVLRIIREEEPPKPSTRLSSSEQLAAIAASRRIEAPRLIKELRGDLDWIVMKGLEKDRDRRYETADGLAADVERHLRDEPVEARPPTVIYQVRKFARRNRTALVVATVLLLAALGALGGIGSAIGWAVRDRAAREQQVASERARRQAQVTGQLEVILQDVARLQKNEKWAEALAAAGRAEPALAAGEADPAVQQRCRRALADLTLVARLEEIRAQSGIAWGTAHAAMIPVAAKADEAYAATFRQAGIDLDALPANEAAKRLAALSAVSAAVLPAIDDWVAVRSRSQDESSTQRLADVLRTADPDPWRQKLREILARQDWDALADLADDPQVDEQPAGTLSFLSSATRQYCDVMAEMRRAGKLKPGTPNTWYPLELAVYRRAQRKYPDDFWLNHRLGLALVYGIDEAAEGVGYLRAALAVRPNSSHIINNLGTAFGAMKRYDDAIENFERAIAISPDYGIAHTCLGIALRRTGEYDRSLAALLKTAEVQPDRPDLVAQAYAEAALLLSNCPDAARRDARRAADLAEQATEMDPRSRKNWTALAIARYRQRQWIECRAALDRAMALGVDGLAGFNRWDEAVDWFYASMCAWQQGDEAAARRYRKKAVNSMKNKMQNEDLDAIRAEAEQLLSSKPAGELPAEPSPDR
jgi:tetratricopeptide (TPR) repeat protein